MYDDAGKWFQTTTVHCSTVMIGNLNQFKLKS